MPRPLRASACLGFALALMLAACGGQTPRSADPSARTSASSGGPATVSPAPTDDIGQVLPAPGSDSEVYAPNPGAIVVAIDPGHGGCLDWGVPNRWDNRVDKAEKADTLAIGLILRDLLEAQGITVVMTRTDDSALAGDDYPPQGCHGPAWRDVDGDGRAGFEPTGRVRTRDELQARIDLVNLARADLLVSIHVNSMTQDGVALEIAATQTFYDDETPWGDASGALGNSTQRTVVAALDRVARYDRQDRGTQAVAYYMVSRQWREGDTCETPGDAWCKPHRGAQMPAVLSEVGSMSLQAESQLLASDAGRRAVADGLYRGISAWLAERPLAVRYDALVPGGEAGRLAVPAPGNGPPFWAPELASQVADGGALRVRLTNTGWRAWPEGVQLLGGREASGLPYLPGPPRLTPIGVEVPALAAGESVSVEVPLESPAGTRHLAWITLADAAGTSFAELGSPALQVADPG
ncbi:MAG TPA: N-acetylmuramoyl-L-alanine amidase [Candidatus Limnocylindria bacterium]|nr:N-acetylmuramoyl-L-alanine amidase [Candidatus Limnocylindria bacterium]